MAEITETRMPGSFILSEANGKRSRENIVVVSGQNLKAGAVLGKITASGKYTAFDNGAGDGSQAAAGVLLADAEATDGDVEAAAVVRDAEVNTHQLVWDDGQSASDIEDGVAELENLGVIVRGPVEEAST